jgi:hypothetical protein
MALRYTVLFLIAGCIPPADTYYGPSQPRSQQGSSSNGGYDSDPYDTDEPPQGGDSRRGAGGQPRGDQRGGSQGSSGGQWWLCQAEGSVGTSDGGSWSYSKEKAFGSAATHDDAYIKAIDDCNALVRMSATLASARGVRYETEACRVVDCMSQR